MAGVVGGQDELIRLCMADYFTGESIINTLVTPTRKVIDWRTRVSGVTLRMMKIAKARQQTLKGWRHARREIWKHIDENTILIGQSLQHDLAVLKMIHTRVVDSGILAKQAVGEGVVREWGLKNLCHELLGITIQTGKRGHDCMEDALAAREVVLWCSHNPQVLAEWGRVKNIEERQKQVERQEEAKRKREALLMVAKDALLIDGTQAEDLERHTLKEVESVHTDSED
jgi:DNA polymerase III epsilon subunit-like protein